YNGKIYWLIELGEGEVPPMLDTQPRMLEAWKNQDKAKLTVIRFSSYQFVDQFSGGLLQLRVKPLGGGPDSFAMGNYIVYGVGPDGSTTAMLPDYIKSRLRPIFDLSRGLGPGDSKPAWVKKSDGGKWKAPTDGQAVETEERTIIGFEAEGTGLHEGL